MRGEAGSFPLDRATVRLTGLSLARHLTDQAGNSPHIVIGRDTRESGAWIEAAFADGAAEGGARCESAGVITTPGVAHLTKALSATAGVVISASHNPYQDNGIKIFAPTGRKLDESIERKIEADIEVHDRPAARIPQSNWENGAAENPRAAELRTEYLRHLRDDIAPGVRFDDLRLVIDCANGAASRFAPELFAGLGAEVDAINREPDGRNINLDCGSLHLGVLSQRVTETGADLGVAYDGDADRALFVDQRGKVVDGDATLWAMAKYMARRGELRNRAVVATVMSNIGLERALRTLDVELIRADVGDKYVLDELLRTGAALGGEQSGHLIFPQVSLAGDGMLTTLLLLRAMTESNQNLEQSIEGFTRYPQVLVNVRVKEKKPFSDDAQIARAVRDVERTLGESGRLLLRYSGTEKLARVMIEGLEKTAIEKMANNLGDLIAKRFG